MRMFQISEDDLADLERVLPALLWANPTIANDVATRVRFRKAKEIISNVRWNYGPPSEVEVIPADDLDQQSQD